MAYFVSAKSYSKKFIGTFSFLLNDHEINIKQSSIFKNILTFGGIAKVINGLAKRRIIFLSQLLSADGKFLLRFSDLLVRPVITNAGGRIP